jgi:Protein of unknown function (DUF3999)
MKTLIALILAVSLAVPAAAQAPLKPEDFAAHGTIETGGAGPFHQLTLPLAVYEGAASADLADLRVFNGQGEMVPYALLRSEPQAVSSQTESGAPFFPLPVQDNAGAGAGDISVTVRQSADGSLVSVHQQQGDKAGATTIVKGAVIDASTLKGRNVHSLRLVTGESTVPFHSFTVESSQDLTHWRTLKDDGQLVHMEHAGQRVDSDRVEWDGTAGRYLRLLWQDPKQAPEIKAVFLGTLESSAAQPVRIWSKEMAPAATKPDMYEYAWAGQLPLERLRINLPQINTLAPVNIQYFPTPPSRKPRLGWHRHREEARWISLAHTVVYRLQAPQGEAKSADIELYGTEANRLRLVVDARSGGIGGTPPSLQIGFLPHVLVFLARGNGPFILAWGAEGVEPAALGLHALVPGYDAKAQLNASPASLPPASIVQAKPSPQGGKVAAEASSPAAKWVLWAVLLGGLAVLGGMARSLILQLRQPPKAEP